MGIEEPKQYTPEEMAEMQKSRTISDAELIKEGASYTLDQSGNIRLEVEKRHIADAYAEKEGIREYDKKELILSAWREGRLQLAYSRPINDSGTETEWYPLKFEDYAAGLLSEKEKKYVDEQLKRIERDPSACVMVRLYSPETSKEAFVCLYCKSGL